MGAIDFITVVVGPPESEKEKDQISATADQSGIGFEELYIEQAPQRLEKFGLRKEGAPSTWDCLFSTALGLTVSIDSPRITYYEKKTVKYPALMFSAETLVDHAGNSEKDRATEVLRNMDHREMLALEFGKSLELDWVRVFVTFG